ncbi:hypothetical protein AMTRI_Chr02g214750 [Amborella trichopoda]
MITWLRNMHLTFGASFIWLIALIYFTQGFRSFVWTAVSYQLKDMLKFSPSASQLVVSVAFFPWSIKPLYGVLSDCIPIKGKKRLPYLAIASILSLFPWILLGLIASLRSSPVFLTILLTLQNLGSAMADVVVDAMIAEAVRREREAFAGELQSLSWSAMALGGISGSLIGGYALTNLRIETIFLLFSIFPTVQLFSCGLVKEIPSCDEVLVNHAKMDAETDSNKAESNVRNPIEGGVMDLQDGWVKIQNGLSMEKSVEYKKPDGDVARNLDKDNLGATPKVGTMRRRKRNPNEENLKAIPTQSELHEKKSLALKWFLSLRLAIRSLFEAFRRPIVLRPMTWFFLSNVTIPNISTIMFYYQTEVLHLEASFLGTARVVGWVGLMLGTFTYNRYLKHMKLRRILMWAHVGLAIFTLLDGLLVSRLNVTFGISDKALVLFGSTLADAINQLKLMPFLIISGQLCPPGIEGTLFALFMSINNLGSTLGSFLGAGLASALHISHQSFDNLLLAIIIQVACTLIPLGFLFLIPKQATGASS